MVEILSKINEKRKENIALRGFDLGYSIPAKREVPLIKPEKQNGIAICEIKRGSPSAGLIDEIKDPVKLAGIYHDNKVDVISVLTEEDHFFGSLNDLMAVKNKYPNQCVLRKDFILFEEEMDITHRAGADMVLLIAASFMHDKESKEQFEKLHKAALDVGLTPLVETHNEAEIELALSVGASVIGINTRDLKTFVIDRNKAYYLKSFIPKECTVIYESGIRSGYEAFMASSGGFDGILVGTSIVSNKDKNQAVSSVVEMFKKGIKYPNKFFYDFLNSVYGGKKPFVKICGITNLEDALAAIENGADCIGFIMADSKRRVDAKQIRNIATSIKDKVYFVAVVTGYSEEAIQLYRDGVIDAIQYHGCFEDESELYNADYLWYKAVSIQRASDYPEKTISPIILMDAFSDLKGGSGKRIDDEIVTEIKSRNTGLFCLAGGIGPENIKEVIIKYNPDFVDLSSKIEIEPGVKNHKQIATFFNLIKEAKEEK